jgi:hypothetical protein
MMTGTVATRCHRPFMYIWLQWPRYFRGAETLLRQLADDTVAAAANVDPSCPNLLVVLWTESAG